MKFLVKIDPVCRQFRTLCDITLNIFFRPQYIGTIGSPLDWRCPSPNIKQVHDYAYRLPADLKHVVSETTLKVLEGGNASTSRTVSEVGVTDKEVAVDFGDAATSYATAAFQRISRQASSKKDAGIDDRRRYEKPTLDISLPHVCVLLSLLNSQAVISVTIQSVLLLFRLHYRYPSTAI